jgi:glycosyltransferase involved in cell wall biosynthesis
MFNLLREVVRTHKITLLALARPEERVHEHSLKSLGLHEVHLAASAGLEARSRWSRLLDSRPYGVRAHGSTQLQTKLAELFDTQSFDIVHVEEAVMAQYFEQGLVSSPLILDRQKIDSWFHWKLWTVHDRTKPVHKRWSGLLEWLRWLGYEWRMARWFTHQIVVSDDDERLLRKVNCQSSIAVVPNGVDVDYFEYRNSSTSEPLSMVFMGSMDFQPNIDAVRFLYSEIYPHIVAEHPGILVYLVGRRPMPEVLELRERDGFVVTGQVPDVRPYLYRSAVSVVPIRIGGGTRLKILESMAAGCPVVSTNVGAQGLRCQHGENILLASDPQAFARCVLDLLNDAEERQRLAINGRHLVEAHYAWPKVAESLLRAYQQGIGGSRSEPGNAGR